MKDGTLVFTVVLHKDGAISCHLQVGPLYANLGFPHVLGTFMGSDEEIGNPREVVDSIEIEIVIFSCFILQVQDYDTYPLSFGETSYAVEFCIFPQI